MEQRFIAIATNAARTAGGIIRENFGGNLNVRHKGAIDLVTDIDIRCEETIFRILNSAFPDIGFLSEEGTEKLPNADSCWIVDPVDGTTNLAHGYPHVGVSIALKLEGALRLGVVYNPFLDELFHAQAGEGAFLNGKKIAVSDVDNLGHALMSTGFPYSIRKSPELPLALFTAIVPSLQGIRRDGAATLDLCYVAAGRLDGFWEIELKPWDMAAGILIIRESGGQVTDYRGESIDLHSPFIVATNGKIHHDLLRLIEEGIRAKELIT
jgi:myo-inositol-1(or 4)-monophosphatase